MIPSCFAYYIYLSVTRTKRNEPRRYASDLGNSNSDALYIPRRTYRCRHTKPLYSIVGFRIHGGFEEWSKHNWAEVEHIGKWTSWAELLQLFLNKQFINANMCIKCYLIIILIRIRWSECNDVHARIYNQSRIYGRWASAAHLRECGDFDFWVTN